MDELATARQLEVVRGNAGVRRQQEDRLVVRAVDDLYGEHGLQGLAWKRGVNVGVNVGVRNDSAVLFVVLFVIFIVL